MAARLELTGLAGGAIRVILTVIIVAAVTVLWSRINANRSPLEVSEDAGVITPGKISAVIVTGLGAVVAAIGVSLTVSGSVLPGLGCSAVGVALIVFMGPSLTHLHDVSWTAEGVSGPCRMFGPSLGISRTDIPWDRIVEAGTTATSYWFVQSDDGRRIYWSYLYPGFGEFVRRLADLRPDLALPNDLVIN